MAIAGLWSVQHRVLVVGALAVSLAIPATSDFPLLLLLLDDPLRRLYRRLRHQPAS